MQARMSLKAKKLRNSSEGRTILHNAGISNTRSSEKQATTIDGKSYSIKRVSTL